MNSRHVTRRDFLKAAAATGAACAVPLVIPGSALGLDAKPAPSQRINVGMIGVGRQARTFNVKQFLGMPDVQILAVCDVDSWRLANGKQQVEEAYAKNSPSGSYKGCDAYKDFRDILARKDIDAVMISAPDHWHVPMALAALEAGKDVSLEKPITRSIGEGRKLSDAVKRSGRVFRVDSELRSYRAHRAGRRAGPQRADRQGAYGDGGRAGQRRRLPAAARDARAAGTRLRGAGRDRPRGPRIPRSGSPSPTPTSGRAGCGTCTIATA